MTRHLLDAFEGTVARAPDRAAFVFLENGEDETERLDFRAVRTRAAAIGAWLAERTSPGDRVLILHRPGPEYIAAVFGSVWAGCIAVPAIPPRPGARIERLSSIVASAKPAIAVADRAIALDGLECFDTAAITPDWAERAGAPRTNRDGIVFLQYTSGSTRAPRGVIVTHDNLLHNVRCIRECLDAEPGAVSVTWLPPYHDMGLIGALIEPLLVGMSTVMMPPIAFLQRPLRWMRAISRYGASHSGGPDFAYALCARSAERDALADLDLSSWRVAYQGAEPVRAETLDRFASTFAAAGFRPNAFVPCYGLAEATLMVTGVDAAAAPREVLAEADALADGRVELARPEQRCRRLISCGPARPEIEVRIVDPESRTPLSDGQVGEIWIAGPSVAAGYWQDPEETRETFGAALDAGDVRFLRSGDLGALVDGELVVTGRLKDLIIVDGRNHAAHDIEDTVSSGHPAFVVGGAAAFSVELDGAERVVIAQEIERARATTLDALEATATARARASEEHGLALWDVVFVRVRALPRTSSGKVRRAECRRAYLAGELQRLAAKTPTHEVESLVRRLLAEHVKVAPDAIDETAPLTSLGLDSKSAVVFSGELARALGRELAPTLCYDHPTLRAITRFLSDGPRAPAPGLIACSAEEPIAVVGIGCRFPGARGPDAFARLLAEGRNAVTSARPSSRPDAAIPGAGGFLDDPSEFDRERFGILPREAEHMDPQQRLVLEVAWEALEHAAIAPNSLENETVDVFVGISNFDYSRGRDPDPSSATGNALSIAANRLSYVLDLRGPSLSIDTACSSSLVAVHQACRALAGGDCEMALAGGVNLMLDAAPSEVLQSAGMLSPDGRCRTFDAGANGYVRGEGCGFVVLEPLSRAIERGHEVLALIRGSAVNQDGRSNGLTAPSAQAQRAVIDAAWRRAGVGVEDIGTIEAHGTGTALGDPIEFNTLAAALRGRKSPPCSVGSVKTNIGHLEAAAGIAGLIKTVLSVRAGTIFPHLHVAALNPALEAGGPVAVVQHGARWHTERRVAAVSSFGFGGTNAHVVVEAAPAQPLRRAEQGPFVALLSARSRNLLPELARAWAAWITAHPEAPLQSICATLALGRVHERERRAWLVSDRESLVAALDCEARGEDDPARFAGIAQRRAAVAFVFDGDADGRALADVGLSPDAVVGRRMEPHVRFFSTVRELLEQVTPRVIVAFGLSDATRRLVPADISLVEADRVSIATVVAQAHVRGVALHWPAVFPGAQRLSGAPGSPARRERYWLPARAATARRPSTGNHPLLGHRVLIPGSDALFQSTVSLELDPELFDHRAYQRVVVAGASQVSLLLGAHRALGRALPVSIRSLSFAQGLLVKPSETRIVQLRVQGSSTFRLVSTTASATAPGPNDVVHAVGELVSEVDSVAAESLWPEIEAVRARATGELDAAQFYELVEGHNIQFGPSYRFNARVWTGDGEALGRLVLPSAVTDAADYDLHPGLIDSSFQLAAATGVERGNDAFILFRIREFRLLRRPGPGEALWAHAVRRTAAHENVHRLDIRLIDDSGRLVAHVLDLELRRASIQGFLRALDPSSLSELFYTVDWQAHTPKPRTDPVARWFVIADEDDSFARELCAALGNGGRRVELATAFDDAMAQNPPEALVYARALTAPVGDITTPELIDAQHRGSIGLLALFRGVANAGTERRTEIHVVARGTAPEAPESRTDWVPVHAPLRGLCKAFSAERPGARVRFVDVGDGVSPARVAQALSAAGDEPELALRAETTWVPRLTRQAQDYVTETRHLDAAATYVVSGGFGALGLEMAHWLASRGARRIALLGRNPPNAVAAARIDELRRMNVDITALIADVSDEAALRAAWANNIQAPVRGVIHAAGVLDDALFRDQSDERFLVPFGAKVAGAWNLCRITRDAPLDFFLAFSSVASLLGSPGQANYAAANSFLDALASHRGHGAISIWWGPWADVGMAARQSAAAQASLRAVGFELLQPSVAVEAAEQVLRLGRSQVAVMAIDAARLTGGRDRVPPLLERLGEQASVSILAKAGRHAHELVAAVRSSAPAAARALLAEHLQHLVAEAAEVASGSIDVDRPLNELGLDSMMALTLQDRLDAELGVTIHITRFMEKVSIGDLAEDLRTGLLNAEPNPKPEPEHKPKPEHEHEHEHERTPPSPRVRRVSAIVAPAPRSLEFSLFYFSRSARGSSDGYRLLREGARFADRNGLTAVWLPERHFHEFGGLYPNPSVLAASLAATTERVRLRAGSVVLPLHHPARVVEEWAVVDNLSGGRVDLSFVRGWGPNDFVLAPESFERRTEVLVEKLDQVRRLWRGEAVEFVNGNGRNTAISVYPKPVQPELDAWLTCTRDDERFVEAGRLGTNVLTALLLQSSDDLARRIELYRRARRAAGHDPRSGRVTLMLHTFIASDDAVARRIVRGPLSEYLRSSVDLWRSGSGTLDSMSEREREKVVDYAFERYYSSSGLLGTPESCLTTALRFRDMGVDEVACLIDFGVDDALTLEALHYLPELQARCASDSHSDHARAIG